jgi:hypothetical protein
VIIPLICVRPGRVDDPHHPLGSRVDMDVADLDGLAIAPAVPIKSLDEVPSD